MGRGWRGDRHNANLPDFFACQMTEPPWRVCGRNPWVGTTERRAGPRGVGTGVGVGGGESERGEGGMKSVLCLETMPILGYILISILRLDAAPYRKGLPLFIPD